MIDHSSPWDIDENPSHEIQHGILSISFASLSELSVQPECWMAFSAGQSLLLLHTIDIIHGDLHTEHMFFNVDDGSCGFIDFGAAEIGNITPEKCALDLLPAFLTMDKKMFHSFLAGYINTAQVVMDVIRPHFTERVLKTAGIRIGNLFNLDEELPDIPALLSKFGLRLSFSAKEEWLLTRQAALSAEPNSPEDIAWLLQILFVLLMADVDYVSMLALIKEVMKESRQPYLTGELQSTFLEENTDIIADENAPVFSAIIKSMLYKYRKEHAPANQLITVYGRIMRVINIHFRPADIESFMDRLTKITDALAMHTAQADRSEKGISSSIRIAQISLLFMQAVAGNPFRDEFRIALMLRRLNRLPWNQAFLGNETSQSIMMELAYAGSRVTLYTKVFKYSLAEPNPLWSIIWRSLRLAKQMLFTLLNVFTNARVSGETKSHVEKIVPHTLSKSASAFRLYYESLLSSINISAFESERVLTLPEVVIEIYRLIDLFGKEKVVSENFTTQLQKLTEQLDFKQPFAKSNTLLR